MAGSLERLIGRIGRYTESLFGSDRHSGDIEWLLAPGRIESLVKEDREPFMTGIIWTPGDDDTWNRWSFYQVPPKNSKPESTKEIYMSNGAYVFVDTNGFQSIGSTFALTREQAMEVERRKKFQAKKLVTKAGNSS